MILFFVWLFLFIVLFKIFNLGESCLAILPTGAGKSLLYMLPSQVLYCTVLYPSVIISLLISFYLNFFPLLICCVSSHLSWSHCIITYGNFLLFFLSFIVVVRWNHIGGQPSLSTYERSGKKNAITIVTEILLLSYSISWHVWLFKWKL